MKKGTFEQSKQQVFDFVGSQGFDMKYADHTEAQDYFSAQKIHSYILANYEMIRMMCDIECSKEAMKKIVDDILFSIKVNSLVRNVTDINTKAFKNKMLQKYSLEQLLDMEESQLRSYIKSFRKIEALKKEKEAAHNAKLDDFLKAGEARDASKLMERRSSQYEVVIAQIAWIEQRFTA